MLYKGLIQSLLVFYQLAYLVKIELNGRALVFLGLVNFQATSESKGIPNMK